MELLLRRVERHVPHVQRTRRPQQTLLKVNTCVVHVHSILSLEHPILHLKGIDLFMRSPMQGRNAVNAPSILEFEGNWILSQPQVLK